PDLQTLCIGVPRQHFHEDLDPDVAQAMEAALRKFKAAGIALVEEDLPIDALNNRASRSIVLYEAGILLPAWLRENGIGIDMAAFHSQIASPDVKAIIGDIMGGAIKESIYRRALHEYRPKMRELWQTYFAKHKVDAIVFPTTPLPARKIQGSDKTVELNNRRTHTLPAYIRNVDPASVVGAPAISIPMGISENRMPIGLEIEAAINNDRRLLAVAQTLSWLLMGQ
ncbi:MAG: amidase family protein, partial [Candidatus Eutrophobiaceae bacterium]